MTPPINKFTADGRVRGFFLAAPADVGSPYSGTPTAEKPKAPSNYPRSLEGEPKEWWEKLPVKPVRRTTPQLRSATPEGTFQFDVPEHLPGSPLCPASVLKSAPGSSVCVYHGRRKTTAVLKEGGSLDA